MKIIVETDERTLSALRRHVGVRNIAGNTDLISITLQKIVEAIDKGDYVVELKLKRDVD